MNIAFLGDSITLGYALDNPDDRFSAVLCRRLGAVERNYGITGTLVARAGLSRDNGTSYIDRISQISGADCLVIFGGTNDYGHGNAPFGAMADNTADTFCGACHVLFRGLIEKYPTAKIVIMTPLQRTGGTHPCENTGKPLLDYVDTII